MWSSLVTLQRVEVGAASSSGIWDFSTFGPDLIVGALTALGVGLVLIWYERLLSGRARGDAVAEQQERAVANGVLLLRPSLIYSSADPRGLLPAGENMNRLRAVVRAVSPDRPSRFVFGFDWLAEAVGAYEQLEVLSESIRIQSDRYQVGEALPVATAMLRRVHLVANLSADTPFDWWDGGTPPAHLAPIATALEGDVALESDAITYVRERRRLNGCRDAFLQAWDDLSMRAHVANLEEVAGSPHWWVKRLLRARRRRRAVEAIERDVISKAEDALNALRGGC